MARNIEKDAKEMAERREKILESGFRIFSERTIEKVTMNDIAKEAGIGVATLYRYYSTKPMLVMAISIRIWQSFIDENIKRVDNMQCTALQEFDGFLEAFLELYREHKDILRFNQFFNVYVQSEEMQKQEIIRPYNDMIRGLYERFCGILSKAEKSVKFESLGNLMTTIFTTPFP